jgi:hypothetical protein
MRAGAKVAVRAGVKAGSPVSVGKINLINAIHGTAQKMKNRARVGDNASRLRRRWQKKTSLK